MTYAISFSINLSYDVDLKTLVKHISKESEMNLSISNFQRQDVLGGVFYYGVSNGTAVAAFNHPTKNHTVGISYPGVNNVTNTSPGIWAVVVTSGYPADLLNFYYNVE